MQNVQDSDPPTASSPGHWCSFVGPRIIRSLITHNPLYLVSACFVLHGTSQLLPKSLDQSSAYNPWPLLGLSCGYLFLLALTAVAIVRYGKVWEDARSILLIIAVMFVELSLALDAALMQNPTTGRWLVVLGFISALLVTEFLIRGLAIRVPGLFRLPLHLMLALVFLYPLLLARAPGQPSVLNANWGAYLFSPLAAAVFLALLPAIRRGREYVRDNGSPWPWPWFPWPLFVVLGAGVCLRGFVLSLSFDPVLSLGYADAMRLQSAYGLYFLAPILLAVAALLLEIGIVEANERVRSVALGIPLACIALSFPTREPSVPYAEFLHMFMGQISSPVLISALAALVFYVVAFLRRVRYAEGLLVVAILAISALGPRTVSIDTMVTPRPALLWLVAGLQLWRGIQNRDSKRTLAGTLAGLAALRVGPLADWPNFARECAAIHLTILAILIVGFVFSDWFARWLRRAGTLLLFLACLAAWLAPIDLPTDLPTWGPACYICTLIVTSLLCTYLSRDVFLLCFALMSTTVGAMGLIWQTYLYLRELPEWAGVRSFLLGFVVLLLAVTISAVKAGLVRKLVPIWPRVVDTLRSKVGSP